MNYKFSFFVLIINVFLLLISCSQDTGIPKPKGYFRVYLPKKQYVKDTTECGLSLKIPAYGKISYPKNSSGNDCWFNIDFDSLKATLFITYKKTTTNKVIALSEDARTMAYKHTIKATNITSEKIVEKEKNIYGLIYKIYGNTASFYQFYATDSISNFLRGSLYFNSSPNQDSLAPVLKFIKKDIDTLLTSIRWPKK